MKLTEKAVEAARINGARSRGPKTEEGKKRSSVNAFRHGLLSKCVVLPNESLETFQLLMQQYVDKLQPADGVEYGKIEEMVTAVWKMRRLWSVETRLWITAGEQHHEPVNMDRIAGAFSDLAKGPELPLLSRYEGKFQRMYQRALSQLLLYQKKRRDDQTNPEEPIICQMEDLDLSPAQTLEPESADQTDQSEKCQRNPAPENPPQNNDLPETSEPLTAAPANPPVTPTDMDPLLPNTENCQMNPTSHNQLEGNHLQPSSEQTAGSAPNVSTPRKPSQPEELYEYVPGIAYLIHGPLRELPHVLEGLRHTHNVPELELEQ